MRRHRSTVRGIRPATGFCETLEARRLLTTVYALTTANDLLTFDSATPGVITSSKPVTGIGSSETLQAIDFRPSNGKIYGFGNLDVLYSIDPATAVASAVAPLARDPADDPNPLFAFNGSEFGADFDLGSGRLRVVTDNGQNVSIDPDTGLVIVDADLNPGDPSLTGIAYDNSFQTNNLYAIDSSTDGVYRLNAVSGTLTSIGLLQVDTTPLVGFDIGQNGAQYASLQVGALSRFYGIIADGEAQSLGEIGDGATPIRDITLAAVNPLVVTNTNDSGPGSLRFAIRAGALMAGPDTISFAIPGPGVHTITPLSTLPRLSGDTLDGFTQPGASPNTLAVGENAAIKVEVDFNETDGLAVANDATVRGLSLFGAANAAVHYPTIDTFIVRATVVGNFIGLRADGTTVAKNIDVGILDEYGSMRIGGTAPAERNVISGNGTQGIRVIALSAFGGNVIQGNYIGTDASGTAARPNGDDGILIERAGSFGSSARIGGTTAGAGNLISGNAGDGIEVRGSSGNVIQGNNIGTNAAGTGPLGNSLDGVRIYSSGARDNEPSTEADDNPIGGSSSAAGNRIAYNSGNGVEVVKNIPANLNILPGEAFGNAIRRNAIFANGGLGIELRVIDEGDFTSAGPGPTPNDPGDVDDGANHLQNAPVIASAVSSATGTFVSGTLNTNANQPYVIDFYDNTAPDPGGFGEGESYVGSYTLTSDAAGNAAFNVTLPFAIPPGHHLTATATTAAALPQSGDTSEFSAATDVTAAPGAPTPTPTPTPTPAPAPSLAVVDASVSEGNGGTKNLTFTVLRAGDASGTNTVNYATSNGTAGSGDYSAKSGTLTFGPGVTTRTVDVTVKGDTKVEADETFFLNLSQATGGATIADGKATGTIVNDDGTPSPTPTPTPPPTINIEINDESGTEGNSGLRAITFKVWLNAASTKVVTTKYATANGTAGSGDYNAANGTLTFAAGQTQKTITVYVKGDTKKEADETFFVNLSNAVNAAIGKGKGTGVIKNDD